MSDASDLNVELCGIEITNLRGFRNAYLSLNEGLTLLVGPNNSGKTSVLRMLDWIINRAEEDTLRGARLLSPEEYDLLVPARRTGGTARRLTLEVWVPDGRKRRRFKPIDDMVQLRVGVNAEGRVRLNLGAPKRSEAPDDGTAMDLLRAIRTSTEYGLVPASRDASSESFTEALRDAVTARIEERAIHARRAGATTEYRKVKKALSDIQGIGNELVAPLWDEMRKTLPPGLAERGELLVKVGPADLVDWMAQHVELRLVTGAHDADSVSPIEVGSGLQSMLELATQQAASTTAGGSRILTIEEPEAYLHPSAQRTLARLISQSLPGKRLVSTHSPLLVEEAEYGDVVLVRDHQFYEPSEVDDETRAAINTALLSGFGAEMSFARSVLLVEGEGDRLYFEQLRRRIARTTKDGRVDELYVVPTGSKTAYGPWLRLLSSYGRAGDRPVMWLATPDGDAATEIRQAWTDASMTLEAGTDAALHALAQVSDNTSDEARIAAETVNAAATREGVRLHMLPIDLEDVMVRACRPQTIEHLCELVGAPTSDRAAFRTWLGNHKAPWMRAVVARETPWRDVSPDARAVLRRWLDAVMPQAEAEAAVTALD